MDNTDIRRYSELPGPRSLFLQIFEQAKMLPKSTHDKIAPQKCFDIAAALHSSSSRGSQLFAKRRAKAKKWEIEGPEPQAEVRPLPVQAAAPLWANNPAAFVSPPGPAGRSNGTQARPGLDTNSNLSSSSSVSSHSMVVHSTPEFGELMPRRSLCCVSCFLANSTLPAPTCTCTSVLEVTPAWNCQLGRHEVTISSSSASYPAQREGTDISAFYETLKQNK